MIDDPYHQGSTSLYQKGCRCTECRREHAAYRRERRRLLEEFTALIGPRLGSWIEQGACHDVTPDVRQMFFSSNPTYLKQAKAICATCPVREQCLEYALESNSRYLWGGTSERQRRVMRRERRTSTR